MNELSEHTKERIHSQVLAALNGWKTVKELLATTEVMREFAESRGQIAVFPEERERARETVKRLEYRAQVIKALGLIRE